MKKPYKPATDSHISISELMKPSNSNFNGKIHGGYILNLMDQIAFACASKHSEAYCVTASVDTVDFLNPIEIGELITLKASINFVGNTSMVVGIRVNSENIITGHVKHCNSSYFTMVAKNNANKSVTVPGLILTNKVEIRRFLKAIELIKTKNSRHKEFNHKSFSAEDYLHVLEPYKVKVQM